MNPLPLEAMDADAPLDGEGGGLPPIVRLMTEDFLETERRPGGSHRPAHLGATLEARPWLIPAALLALAAGVLLLRRR